MIYKTYVKIYIKQNISIAKKGSWFTENRNYLCKKIRNLLEVEKFSSCIEQEHEINLFRK